MFFKVYLSNIDSAEKREKGDYEFWAGASHFIMTWNITVRYKFCPKLNYYSRFFPAAIAD